MYPIVYGGNSKGPIKGKGRDEKGVFLGEDLLRLHILHTIFNFINLLCHKLIALNNL